MQIYLTIYNFSKKAGAVNLVPINQLYTPPSELSVGDTSNIFKPDDNPTDIERGHNIELLSKNEANLFTACKQVD